AKKNRLIRPAALEPIFGVGNGCKAKQDREKAHLDACADNNLRHGTPGLPFKWVFEKQNYLCQPSPVKLQTVPVRGGAGGIPHSETTLTSRRWQCNHSK